MNQERRQVVAMLLTPVALVAVAVRALGWWLGLALLGNVLVLLLWWLTGF